ncbi:DnaJ protein-like [Hondaea fermentalgiana]|uniref:DnaJ protein-like n=1 Tax=Hondaea fermentalgiana TaxID=2315210 RepID=A0A2R5G4J0_9STRA|nr:DnaJ protein-like [Hondaea fermentalgiana]|eukprot:GBG25947.1 DnaJ protein-like [Hondaea fermentalgiana]
MNQDCEDLYLVLGVQRGATSKEIRAAYLRLAKVHHPDRGGTEQKFQQIQEAYRVLSDASERSSYDQAGSRSNWTTQQSTDDADFAEHLRKQREFAAQFTQGATKFSNYNVDEWERAHGLGKYANNSIPEDLREYFISIKKAEEKERLEQEAKKMSKHQAFHRRQQARGGDRMSKLRDLMRETDEVSNRRSFHTFLPNRNFIMRSASFWIRKCR